MKLLKWGIPTIAAGALMLGAAFNAQAQDTAMQQQGADQPMGQTGTYVPPATDTTGTQVPTVPNTTPPTVEPTVPPTTDYGTGGSGTAMRDAGTGGFDDYGTGGAGTAGRDAGTGMELEPNTGTTGYDTMPPTNP